MEHQQIESKLGALPPGRISLMLFKQAMDAVNQAESRISRLEELLTVDELTGLKNRQGFEDAFEKEVDRCKRGQSCGGVLLLIDLDNFYQVNADYGTVAGNAALRMVARTLESQMRRMDIAARLESDEFVLLLSNVRKNESIERAQHLIWHLNKLVLPWNGEDIRLQASLGLKGFAADDSIMGIMGEADDMLSANKRFKKGENSK